MCPRCRLKQAGSSGARLALEARATEDHAVAALHGLVEANARLTRLRVVRACCRPARQASHMGFVSSTWGGSCRIRHRAQLVSRIGALRCRIHDFPSAPPLDALAGRRSETAEPWARSPQLSCKRSRRYPQTRISALRTSVDPDKCVRAVADALAGIRRALCRLSSEPLAATIAASAWMSCPLLEKKACPSFEEQANSRADVC